MFKHKLSSILLLVSFTVVSFTSAQATKVGNWDIAYWPNNNGGYDGCHMQASYKSGIRFSIGVTAKYAWGIVLSHPNWTLQKDQKLPMELVINDVPVSTTTATALDAHTLVLPLQNTSTFKALQ